MTATVTAVARSATHTLSKPTEAGIRLLAGLGAEGDAHLGRTVKHRARATRSPSSCRPRPVARSRRCSGLSAT